MRCLIIYLIISVRVLGSLGDLGVLEALGLPTGPTGPSRPARPAAGPSRRGSMPRVGLLVYIQVARMPRLLQHMHPFRSTKNLEIFNEILIDCKTSKMIKMNYYSTTSTTTNVENNFESMATHCHVCMCCDVFHVMQVVVTVTIVLAPNDVPKS